MEPDINIVIDNIRQIRIEKKISIIQLAKEAEIAHSYIYYIESKKKIPSLTILLKLAKALDVNIKDFFKGV